MRIRVVNFSDSTITEGETRVLYYGLKGECSSVDRDYWTRKVALVANGEVESTTAVVEDYDSKVVALRIERIKE